MLLKVHFYKESQISCLPQSGANVEDKISRKGQKLLLMKGRKIRLITVTHLSNHLFGLASRSHKPSAIRNFTQQYRLKLAWPNT